MDIIKQQTVYVLIAEHEIQVLQQVLGVYTSFEKIIEAQKQVTIPTALHETYFDYEDDYPVVKNEFAIVETTIVENRTCVIRATNLSGTYKNTRQMTFVDPDIEYVLSYIDCLHENEQVLVAAFPDGYEVDMPFDLGEDNMDELRKLINTLT